MAEPPLAKLGPATPSRTTLNDLSQELLLRILTFLPLNSAIRASFLSRKWRNLWHSLPSLKFKGKKVCRNPTSPSARSRQWLSEAISQALPNPPYNLRNPTYLRSHTLQHLSDFFSLVLFNRPNNLPFHKFSLRIRYPSEHRYRSLVTSWLRYAVNCEVVVLKLDFRVDLVKCDENGDDDGSEDRPLYDFHFCHLRNNTSVRFLMLCRCEIFIPSDRLLCFGLITRLELVEVDVADAVLTDLVWMCESLEKLVLSGFQGLRKFRIVSRKLKDLELSCYYVKLRGDLNSSAEIYAPNLSRIKIDRFYVKNYKGDLSSVVDAELEFRKRKGYAVECWINSMRLLTGVERLSVQNYLPKSAGESFEFKNLKHLVIKTGYTDDEMFALAALLMWSPLLQTIVLDSVYHKYDSASFSSYEVSPFIFDIPSLQVVEMTNFKNTDIEYHVLALLESKSMVLNKVILVSAKLEKASLNGPIVFDLTAYRDWTSVITALLRCHYIIEK